MTVTPSVDHKFYW